MNDIGENERLRRQIETLIEKTAHASDELSYDGQHPRAAIQVTLNAVIDFLDENADLRELDISRPLKKLSIALSELDRGKVMPVLSPKKMARGKNSRKSRNEERLAAIVAANVAALRMLGLSRKEAANKIARNLGRYGLLKGTHGTNPIDTEARILEWFDTLEANPKLGAKLTQIKRDYESEKEALAGFLAPFNADPNPTRVAIGMAGGALMGRLEHILKEGRGLTD